MSDATTIAKLELEVESSSKNAESGLNNLINTLDRLKTATKGGLGLTSVVKRLDAVHASTSKMSHSNTDKLYGLAKAIQLLGGVKISSTISKQIGEISTALSSADFTGGQEKITEMVEALRPIESLGKSSLGTTVNALKKLPDALKNLDTRKLYTQISSLTRIFKPLADEMQKVANGFSALPSKIQKLVRESDNLASTNNKVSTSQNKVATSSINLYAKLKMATSAVKGIASGIADTIKSMSSYIENVNLFEVSMGNYASSASDYAKSVSEVLGIDPSEWMRNQGVFMTLATGFGVATDKANTMSQELTKLGYDISSFFNISYEDAMQKLQSGFSGELEPLRRLGYDLSQAKLESIALSLGIDKSVSSMTQAEKAQLRYYAIMTQVTTVQGDMARTLNEPANQMRIFKAQVTQAARAIGGIFIPMLNQILPYAIAVAKVIAYLASSIASLFGFELPEIGDAGVEAVVGGAEETSDAFEEATKSAKKLKSYMLGFDELNVLNPNEDSGDSGSTSSSVVGDLDIELPTYTENFIPEATESRVNQIVEDMKEWLGITDEITSWSDLLDTKLGDILIDVGLIGAGFGAWKLSNVLSSGLESLSSKNISWSFSVVGATLFMADLNKLKEFVDDFKENGASFTNVSGMLSEFAGLVGDSMIMLGNTKTGGALKVVQGVGEIVSAVSDMSQNGVNVDNITDAIRGITNITIGIGALTGHLEVTGIAMIIQSITEIINELAENWEAIRNGDWSGVDKATLVVSAIEFLGGIATAIIGFKKIKGIGKISTATDTMKDVKTVTSKVSTTTSSMTSKLTSLAKNLGLGLVILAEVAAAAVLFVGAIWLLGVELEQVGIAWEPVIEHGNTILIAMGIGTGILVAIGAITAALGTAGAPLIVNLGLGIAILAEIGIAAGLFIAEILAIGILLDKVGDAWEPVLTKGETIKTAILTGTAILVAIGVVTAALGVATVATAGLLPIAIGLGTALLLEVGIAAGLFITEIKAVGDGLNDVADAWEPVLKKGETVEAGISTGTELLIKIGTVAAALGAASVATVGLLPLAIALGTDMLIDLCDAFVDFTDGLIDVAKQITDDLHPELVDMNAVLPTVSTNMSNFTTFMKDFVGEIVSYTVSNTIASIAATVDKFVDFFTTDPIKRLSDEVSEQYDDIVDLIDDLTDTIPKIERATQLLSDYNDAMAELQAEAGTEQSSGVLGFVLQFAVNVKNTANEWWSNVKKWWGEKVGAVAEFTTTVKNNAATWWSNVKSWWSKDSSAGVDVKVNAKKGWSSTIKSALGIPDSYSLGFKLPKIKVTWGEKEVLGFKISFPSGFETYAQGGFPDIGQMFIAREAGPELVGNIGSRTAVVNNDQIVESVSAGVYQAVIAALGSGNSDDGNTQIVINLDGEKIYENQQKIARNRGYNLGMGAFSFG